MLRHTGAIIQFMKKVPAKSRNTAIISLTRDLFLEASKIVLDNSYLPKNLLPYTTPLIKQKALGFREIVFTAIIARLYGIDFDPTLNFYDCNPRSIYELAIREVLEEFKIPCGKSGPLNVAKNENALNKDWARGRRPEEASFAAVAFLEKLKPGVLSSEQLKRMALFFAKKLLEESSRLQAITTKTISGLSLRQHHFLYLELIKQCPDGGKTPQFIIAKSLEVFHELFETNRKVQGADISISASDITSKKPSDLWETDVDSGEIKQLYEITVKKVDVHRLKDSVRSLSAYGLSSGSVVFICRIPEDVKELCLDCFYYKDMGGFRYEFIDIFEWILFMLEKLGEKGRIQLFEIIKNYIGDFKTKESIKICWNELIGKFSGLF